MEFCDPKTLEFAPPIERGTLEKLWLTKAGRWAAVRYHEVDGLKWRLGYFAVFADHPLWELSAEEAMSHHLWTMEQPSQELTYARKSADGYAWWFGFDYNGKRPSLSHVISDCERLARII